VRALRSPLLAGVLAILSLGGMLAAVVAPPSVSATGAAPHPVRPQVHRLRLAGVDQAALAVLRRQQPGARPAVLTPPRPTEAFRLLGVSWTPGAGVPEMEVEVRTRDARGWSGWQPLELEGAVPSPRGALPAADDHASTRAGTEPLYTGPSSGVQVRVDGSGDALPADLRVDLVDPRSRPTASSTPGRRPPWDPARLARCGLRGPVGPRGCRQPGYRLWSSTWP
jgi:hypothetical protein